MANALIHFMASLGSGPGVIAGPVLRFEAGNRYDKALNTEFGKRFSMVLKLSSGVNSNITEKLTAHKQARFGWRIFIFVCVLGFFVGFISPTCCHNP